MTDTWDSIIARWDTNIRLAKWLVIASTITSVLLTFMSEEVMALIHLGFLTVALLIYNWCVRSRKRCIEQAQSFGWRGKGAEE